MAADALCAAARLYEAYNRHAPAEAAALYADEGVHAEIAQGRESKGREEIERGLETFFASFPDARWEPERRIGAGGEAAVTYVVTGTLRARLGPFEARGQRLELRGVHVLDVSDDGLIVRSEDYWDAATFSRQMLAG